MPMTFWSIISSVAGTNPAAITAETPLPACSIESNATIIVLTPGGLRIRRTSAARDNAERAFAANQNAAQIIFWIIQRAAPQMDDLPIRQYDF